MTTEVPTSLGRSAEAEPVKPDNRHGKSAAEDLENRQPPVVLVVDDDTDSADLTATIVQLGGGRACTAGSGCEAISIAAEQRPDAIFLDISLPDMSGYDVCRAIRGQRWAKETAIVAVSGWPADGGEAYRSAGFDAYLVKPVDPQTILGLLTSLG